MANTVSPYFDDEDVICELRTFFELDEMWNIDFASALTDITDSDDDNYLQLELNNRTFYIDRFTGDVFEEDGGVVE